MSENGNHPLRPSTEYCRIRPLMKWTGWSREFIRYLESTGKLKPYRRRNNPKYDPPSRQRKGKFGHRYYRVVEIDGIIASK